MKASQADVNALLNSPLFREIFFPTLDQIEAEEDRVVLNRQIYDNPSWAYLQADNNGAKRILAKMRQKFTIKES